jgi:hypothetical protein
MFVSHLSPKLGTHSPNGAYGPRGGFCIGIKGDRLVDLVREQEFYLAPCIYEKVLQQRLLHALIEEILEENTLQPRPLVAKGPIALPGGNLRDYLLRYAPILKDPSFVEEQCPFGKPA